VPQRVGFFRDCGILIAKAARRGGELQPPSFHRVNSAMPKRRQQIEPQEPIGIVISGGPHEVPRPRLSAYVYSIEDETSGEPLTAVNTDRA
jgi:hypothetical protein